MGYTKYPREEEPKLPPMPLVDFLGLCLLVVFIMGFLGFMLGQAFSHT